MAKKWTVPNAVKKFKPHQKGSLDKNNGNLNARQLDSLIKEMKCYYEVVEVNGKGKNRIIFTDKKRKVKAKKEDKRQFNKGIAPPHSKHLALMVMSKINSIDNMARTRNGWATYFGLVSPAEQDIMKGIYSVEALKPYKKIMISLDILKEHEEKIFQDLAHTLTKVAKGHLETVLNQAEKMKLIRVISSWKGKVKDSKEPIDIDKVMAIEINNMEAELLKKHEISKSYSLMFKNSSKTKAFKAEWLEYIENVVDVDDDAMNLQYIYEVFRIEVLNKSAFDEYIKAHYPSEAHSFNLFQNEKAYHTKLLDYVIANAQKKHENYMGKKHDRVVQSEEGLKEFWIEIGMSEEEAVEYSKQSRVEDAYIKELESSPYTALLESDVYVDCIRNLHIQLHGMSFIESGKIKNVQQKNDEQKWEELERLGLSNPVEEESKTTVKNQIRNNDDSRLNAMEQQKELIKREQSKQHQVNEPAKKIILENTLEKRVTTAAESNIEPSNHYNEIQDDEYQAAMEDIRNEIREYEEKYGDKAMEYIRFDSVIRELTREVTEESIDEFKQKLQREKERERKEWEKLFERGQPVKWKRTTNHPLEVFQRIRDSGIDKEDS
ncbi:hypothetical protein ACFS6F_12160 [Halobacillus naozhouensis]|uniref:hypothetical protein n=1 Tax=Halobacillus naozhouensis TaxID=554880 RepID=UPI00362C0DF7